MDNNNFYLDDYIKILNILNSEYFKFQNRWLSICSKHNVKINLNSNQIRHIYDRKNARLDFKFLELINMYYDLVDDFHIKIKIKILKETNIMIESRIKDFDSLLFKISKKSYEDNGTFSINKAVNDILGFRLVDVKYAENIDLIYKYIESEENLKKMNRIKIIDRNISKSNYYYKATHIYFRGINNYCIPLELQIWNKRDEEVNRKSHKIHKQGYISNIEGYTLLNKRKGVE